MLQRFRVFSKEDDTRYKHNHCFISLFFPPRKWILVYRKIEQSVKTQLLHKLFLLNAKSQLLFILIHTHKHTRTHPPITCYIVFLFLFPFISFFFSFFLISSWFFFVFVSSSNFSCNQSLALRRSQTLAQTPLKQFLVIEFL